MGELLRVADLERRDRWPGASDVARHDVLCSLEGRAWMGRRIHEQGIERVLIGACSPLEHEETFRSVLAAAVRLVVGELSRAG